MKSEVYAMKKALWIIICCLFSGYPDFCIGSELSTEEESSFQIMQEVAGVEQPVVSLDGVWQFRYSPADEWSSIQVPGEAAMQGYAISHDKPFVYLKKFFLPADYSGKRIILRFDGVYSHARLFINGTFVREHHGGFTRWETDVTSFVRSGESNELQLEVTDRIDDISYASGYAHHPIGGILRSVTLFALPSNYMSDFYTETDFDEFYRNAVLKIAYTAQAYDGYKIEYRLTSPDGKDVNLPRTAFIPRTGKNVDLLEIKQPVKWDAEHPNLYELTVCLYDKENEIGRFSRNIGFREVKIDADRMLVNGRPVKLRGACRHDIHPMLGRTTTAELDSLDVVLFKESNMNFVRTSHYPPSERFLEFCDRFGIYVECETAVCFVDTYRQKNYAPGKTQDSAEFAPRYLSQCREMVKSFRSHPSVLFWSIGNESVYGANFQQCWDWIKKTDPERPVIFSYPGSVGNHEKIYDILSMHYQDVNGNLDQWNRSTRGFQGHGIPALFDEWAHPACYTYATLQTDPNIREFWGISLDKMWNGLFDAPGGLGGAIWGYVDETFMLPEPKKGDPFWKEFARTAKPENFQGNCVGYGEWGIVDVWRRKKPEFWSTKKAYSPVRLMLTQTDDFVAGESLHLPVYNRFDHTDLNEIDVYYTYKGKRKKTEKISLAPHQKGMLTLPAQSWRNGESILLEFFTSDGSLLDAEMLTLGKDQVVFPQTRRKGTLSVEETDDFIRIKGKGFEIPFSKQSGQICEATSHGKVIIERGPFLNLDINLNHLTGAEIRKSANKFILSDLDWEKKSLTYEVQENEIHVYLSASCKNIPVYIRIRISDTGKMKIVYEAEGIPNGYVREAGICFYIPERLAYLTWKRKGYWSYYPEESFAGNTGSTFLYNSRKVAYGEDPAQSWASDTHNYYYWADAGANCSAPLMQQAKGMKENIYYYTLSSNRKKTDFSVVSEDTSLACRMNKHADGQLVLYVNTRWDYPEIAWGNFCKALEAVPCKGEVDFMF